MQWFRFHCDFLDDPKVQTLSKDNFKILVNSLCLACKTSNKLGTINDVSFALRETFESVSSAFHTFIELRFIATDGETFHFINWNKRQYKSDTSTNRVKQFRKRSKTVTVTAPDTDTDTDTDTEKRQRIAETYPPPNGVLDEVWGDYLEMRKKMRKPMTRTAYKKTCDAIMKTMQDPNEVVSQSVQRGWIGIFEIKQEGKPNGTYSNGNGQVNRRHNPDDEIKRAYAKGLVLLNSD